MRINFEYANTEIWDNQKIRKKAFHMVQRIVKESGIERNGKISYKKKSEFDGIVVKELYSKVEKKVGIASALVCEYITDGKMLMTLNPVDEKERKLLIIEAIRWLQYLFSEENFSNIITWRTDSEELKKIGHKLLNTQYEMLVLEEWKAIIAALTGTKGEMSLGETREQLVRGKVLEKLDQKNRLENKDPVAMTFFTMYLWDVAKEKFHIYPINEIEFVQDDIRSNIQEFFLSIQGFQEGKEKELERWKEYDIPLNIAIRLTTVEPKSLILIVAAMSDIPSQEVEELFCKVVSREKMEQKTKEKRKVEKTEIKKLRKLLTIPCTTRQYIGDLEYFNEILEKRYHEEW